MANVARSLNSIAGDIRNHHDKVKAAHGKALEHAKKAGEALSEAKEQVSHGEWATWLERNAPEVSDRTARVYMRIANNWEQIESKTAESADLSIDKATKLISKPKPAPAAIKDAGGGDDSIKGENVATEPPEPVSVAAPESADNTPDTDDVDELAGRAKEKKPGAEQVSVKERRAAYDGLGRVVRCLQSLGKLKPYKATLNQVAAEIKPPKN